MSHARRGKVLYIPGTRPERFDDARETTARRDRKSQIILGASVVGALGLFWAGATLTRHEENVGIRSLPAAERQNLYTRTMDELATVCQNAAAAGGELHDHCVAQARFVLDLPECADACERAAAAVLPHARR